MSSSTYRIYIEDAEEKHAPPSLPVLEVGICGSTVYLTIGEMQETSRVRTFKGEAQIAVDVLTLTKHLESLVMLEAKPK